MKIIRFVHLNLRLVHAAKYFFLVELNVKHIDFFFFLFIYKMISLERQNICYSFCMKNNLFAFYKIFLVFSWCSPVIIWLMFIKL